MERAVRELGFEALSIFRPSQLTRPQPERGHVLERLGLPFFALLDRMLPEQYRGIEGASSLPR